MRISVFTREEQETKKIFISFFNLALDQLQVYSDLTYFRNGDTDLIWQRTDLQGVGTSCKCVFFLGPRSYFMAFSIQTALILFTSLFI